MPLALITDCAGETLSEDEIAFFNDAQPFGFILFQRNCQNPEQVKALVKQLRNCVTHPAPVFIDQEGGRVARMKPPHWQDYPAAACFAQQWQSNASQAERACYLNARLLAHELVIHGINADCAPLADIPIPGAHDVIGDRAFGYEPDVVIALARAQAQGLMDSGVLPVLKHIPGHGRAMVDSHHDLPVVEAPLDELEVSDFIPFKALADLPFAMTAHIRYMALDADKPATLSNTVIDYIREKIGFTNLLMSDDISMKALKGSLDTIATQTLDAGCDLVLHCNGSLEERMLAAKGCRALPDARYALYEQALGAIADVQGMDNEAMRAERDSLMQPQAA